ncbi:MAG TPA: hypothetical protein VFN97_12665 [Actinospica sp.]|nr:hypothetical protein [Actinospica sp.]
MTDLDTTARVPGTRAPIGESPGGRSYASSNVTRLLCAGTYLDDGYRRSVIQELLIERYRQIAPSYGYDVVPVLGHALAARQRRIFQSVFTIVMFVLIGLLWITGVLGAAAALLLFGWAVWAGSFMIRLSTLETLIRDLKPARPGAGGGTVFEGGYPFNNRLGPDLCTELEEQQSASADGVIYYGGFVPFIGAGFEAESWANAEMLIAARPNPLLAGADEPEDERDAEEAEEAEEAELIPFDVREITDYVHAHLLSALTETADPRDRIENVVVERRKYAKAVARHASDRIDTGLDVSRIHWEESHAAAREYLCIRIGSWDQELVPSMFVGFDIKGSTLHTEFYTYVLPPVRQSFHVVDRLPDDITLRLMGRVAWAALKATPGEGLGALLRPLAERLPNSASVINRLDRKLSKGGHGAAGDSSLGLAQFAGVRLDRGARFSVRELATLNELHHFFQRSDMVKYAQVVERTLLHTIEVFLSEHNVDLTDHRATQANILNQSFGDVNNYGDNSVTSQGNRGRQNIRQRISNTRKKEEH